MFNIFGSKKVEEKKPIPQVNLGDTCNRLGGNINDVKLKLEVTDKELKTALEAYRNARNPTLKQQAKQKATNILKKKKMYESHLNNLYVTQNNVETTQMQTQMMKDNIDIMNTMKGTIQVQKEMMGSMNTDDVYTLMDDMKDLQEDQADFNEALQRNYEVDVADEELDAELDELDYQMKVEFDTKEMAVPNNRVFSQKEKDEKELNEMLK